MLSRRRTGPTFLALLVLALALALGAGTAAQAAPVAPSTDASPRLTALFGSVWDTVLARLSPLGTLFAAEGEDPPPDPDPEDDDDDPLDGSGGNDPGSGSGLLDPNGGST